MWAVRGIVFLSYKDKPKKERLTGGQALFLIRVILLSGI